MQIHINGKMYEIFFPETKGFSPLGRQQIIVELKEGTNNMTIKNPVATAIDSSYIQYKRMGNALKEASSMWARLHIQKKSQSHIPFANGAWLALIFGVLKQAQCGAQRPI